MGIIRHGNLEMWRSLVLAVVLAMAVATGEGVFVVIAFLAAVWEVAMVGVAGVR